MSAEAATALAHPHAQTRSHILGWRASAGLALALAFAVRVYLATLHATPEYFPDEYIYAALGRSFASLHGTTVRGAPAHFPALLQPLVTAPAWRAGSVETGFRLVTVIESAFFTLAAIPVYLLGIRLALSRNIAAFAAALALLVPDAIYSSFVLADPIAYPLAMAAVLAGVMALAQPTRRSRLVFLALAVLASAARIQFLVLPLCYLAAALVLGARERSLRRVVREQIEVGGLLALAVGGALARGPGRVIGYYDSALHMHPHLGALVVSAGQNLLVLAYASGWILVPGAVIGCALALARPRNRVEAAFGAFAPVIMFGLLVEATFFGGTAKTHERYAFYAIPLVVLSFGLHASRAWPLRRLYLGLTAALFLLGTQPFLAAWAQLGSDDHSPFLFAVRWLELQLGNGEAALVISIAASLLALSAAAASMLPSARRTAIVLAAAAVASGCAYAGAAALDARQTAGVRGALLPTSRSWVDDRRLGSVTLVATEHGKSGAAEEQLFWNRSVDRVAVFPGAMSPDPLPSTAIGIRADGTMELTPHRTNLLVDEYGATLVLRHASTLATGKNFVLLRSAGAPQLALAFEGRAADGWLAADSRLSVWPQQRRAGLHGWLTFSIGQLQSRHPAVAATRAASRWTFAARGAGIAVRIPVCSTAGWSADFHVSSTARVDGRLVSGRATMPRFAPDTSACG